MPDLIDPANNADPSVVADPNEPSQNEPTQDPISLDTPADPQQDPQQVPTPSPREERRAESLSKKLRESSQQRAQLEQELNQRRPAPQGPDYNAPDLTVDKLQQDREQYGQSNYQRGISDAMSQVEQKFFQENLDRDTEVLESKYDLLNPDSENYDQNLVEDINSAYLDAIGFDQRTGAIKNPNVRFKDYAGKFIKIATRYADSASADAARNVATQASRTGVRPNSPSRRSSMGELQPGDISNMSSKDYEKNRSAIDAQIKRSMGL